MLPWGNIWTKIIAEIWIKTFVLSFVVMALKTFN